jgi:hypothetical protein
MSFAASFGFIPISSAYKERRLYVRGNRSISLKVGVKLMKLKDFDFKKLSKECLRVSLDKVKSIKTFTTESTGKLYNFASLSIYSIYSFIREYFVRWHYKTFIRPKGIAFVGGLEYANDVHNSFLKIVNKNPGTRFYNLGAIFQALDAPKQIRLFLDNITEKEMGELEKVLTAYLTKANELSIPDTWDLIRAFLGPLWLIKRVFRKDLFTVFVGVLDPKEAEWLRKQGYYLVYLQSKEMLSRWEKGYTYCALSYDLTLFENITDQTFLNIFSKAGLAL